MYDNEGMVLQFIKDLAKTIRKRENQYHVDGEVHQFVDNKYALITEIKWKDGSITRTTKDPSDAPNDKLAIMVCILKKFVPNLDLKAIYDICNGGVAKVMYIFKMLIIGYVGRRAYDEIDEYLKEKKKIDEMTINQIKREKKLEKKKAKWLARIAELKANGKWHPQKPYKPNGISECGCGCKINQDHHCDCNKFELDKEKTSKTIQKIKCLNEEMNNIKARIEKLRKDIEELD